MLNQIRNLFTRNIITSENEDTSKTPQLIANLEIMPRHYYSKLNHGMEDLYKVSFKPNSEDQKIFYFQAQKMYSHDVLNQKMAEYGFKIVEEVHPSVQEKHIKQYILEKVANDA